MRQVVLDTETTGLEVSEGHRIIEIGAIEIIDRNVTGRQFHHYLCPDREIDAGAMEVHGITLEELENKPRFHEIADEFIEFVRDSELIIHNAPFDIGFLNAELALTDTHPDPVEHYCSIFDTLPYARRLHPGQRNSLDALCKRYEIDNSQRELHGALLDAQILADVYLAMTGGQVSLGLADQHERGGDGRAGRKVAKRPAEPLRVIEATQEELAAHESMLEHISTQSEDGSCIWQN